MGQFTSIIDHNTALKNVEIPRSDKKRVHLVGVKARTSADIKLTHGKNIEVAIKSSPFNGPKGIWVIDIKGIENGGAILKAELDSKPVASLDIKIFTKINISLGLENNEQGMLTRLFLAESINPGNGLVYDEGQSKTSMLWMRKVIENRLAHKTPNIFGAVKPIGQSKYTIYDIVKAKNQFHGFEKYPEINSSIKLNLTSFLAIANNYNHVKRELYANFIANAKSAASKNALRDFIDTSPKGLYGWRTKGSSAPGGDFKKYKDFAGQTFYTLK